MRKTVFSLSLLALAGTALAQSASTDPQTVAWRDICDNNYYWNLGLQTPWDPNTRLGIDLSNVLCSDLAKDWDVYHRRLSPSDVGLAKSGASAASGANVFFSLYNRRAGVLRTFIWLDAAQDAPGTYYSVRLNVQDGGSTKSLDHSLFAYEGGGSAHSVVERMNPAKNNEKMYFTDRHVNNRWIVEDTHISFDMNGAHSNALYFDYLVFSHDVGNIKLTGSIGGDGVKAAQLGTMSSAMNVFNSTKSGFNTGFKGTKEAASSVKGVGEKLKAMGGNGQFLIDLAAKAGGAATGVGAIMAGSELIKGFLGWGGGGQTGMAPSVISMNGTISYVRSTTNPRIPLANANFIESQKALFAKTYPATADKNLGLYVMNVSPEVKVWYVDVGPINNGRAPAYYSRQYYFSISDPTCGLYINPASGAKLKEMIVRPEINIGSQTVQSPDPHYGSHSNPAANVYPAFSAPVNWNKVKLGPTRKVYSATPRDNMTINVKVSMIFDIGRGETFEAVNSYDPSGVTYAKTGSITTARDFGTCGAPSFLRTALEQGSSDLNVYSESGGPNFYTLFGYTGAVGSSVAVSGKVGDGQNTAMSIPFTGSGASFNWKVSSEPNWDKLQVLVDYVVRAEISGQTNWATQDLSFPYGQHTLSFNYVKDGSLQLGEDRGMVDNLILR